MESTSTAELVCINYQSSKKQLEAKLRKYISPDKIKLTTEILNQTAIKIRIQSNNYVGIFHVSCHLIGEENKGNVADVIVKSKYTISYILTYFPFFFF